LEEVLSRSGDDQLIFLDKNHSPAILVGITDKLSEFKKKYPSIKITSIALIPPKQTHELARTKYPFDL
tara:strand:- start:1062 stop:1265 length:204 start_codon:yes stop_codon:yes gene_type:complete